MPDALQPLRLLLLVVAGRVNRDQARTIEFPREENRVLRELTRSAARCSPRSRPS